MARASAGGAAVEHFHRRPSGQPPGNAEAHHAGADNGDARFGGTRFLGDLLADILGEVWKVVRQARLPSLE
jgi:hypothetical protein